MISNTTMKAGMPAALVSHSKKRRHAIGKTAGVIAMKRFKTTKTLNRSRPEINMKVRYRKRHLFGFVGAPMTNMGKIAGPYAYGGKFYRRYKPASNS